jgi:hypothetical protein
VAKLTREQERQHAEACRLVDLDRPLTEDERCFVLDHWLESSTSRNSADRAHFTPAGLANDMSLHVHGDRIIDLAAGIGRLAFHNRNLWGRWPRGGPEFVCVERNPDYVRVGKRVMPEARWICADLMDLPRLRAELGTFDTAISNPPFGALPRTADAPGGYRGRRFEYHVIALAATLAGRGVFIIPQNASPFAYSGQSAMDQHGGDDEYRRFAAVTGIELEPNCGIDTSYYDDQWRGVSPRVEIVQADFTANADTTATTTVTRPLARERGGVGTQLALLG